MVAALLVALLIAAISDQEDASQSATRSQQALVQVAGAEAMALNMETGLRGYVITRRRNFLTPYRQARAALPGALAELQSSLSGDPAQAARASAVSDTLRGYADQYAPAVIALVRHDPAAARSVRTTVQGKTRIDAIRRQLNTILAVERASQLSKAAGARSSAHRARIEGIVVLVMLALLVAALAFAMQRIVVRPLRALLAGIEALERGELSTRVPEGDATEVGRLGGAINRMAGALRESRIELEQRNRELAGIAERNLLLLDSVYTQTPVGLAFLDAELRYVRVNDALARMNGARAEEYVGRRVGELEPDLLGALAQMLESVLRSEREWREHEYVLAGPPARAWLIDAYPVRQDDELIGLGVVVSDVSERHMAAAERESLLAAERDAAPERAGAPAGVVPGRGQLGARRDAGRAAVAGGVLASRRARVRRPVRGRPARQRAPDHRQPRARGSRDCRARGRVRAPRAHRRQRRRRPRRRRRAAGRAHGPCRAARDGASALIDSLTSVPEQRRVLAALGLTSAMVVPMIARGHILGVISFFGDARRRRYDREDLASRASWHAAPRSPSTPPACIARATRPPACCR